MRTCPRIAGVDESGHIRLALRLTTAHQNGLKSTPPEIHLTDFGKYATSEIDPIRSHFGFQLSTGRCESMELST